MAKHTVSKGADGFFRVSTQPESSYYTDKETADRVARQLDAEDAEKAKAAKGAGPVAVADEDEDAVG